MRALAEFKLTTNRKVYNILYKLILFSSSKINCSFCPFNYRENKKSKNQKSWKRSTKRRSQYKVLK